MSHPQTDNFNEQQRDIKLEKSAKSKALKKKKDEKPAWHSKAKVKPWPVAKNGGYPEDGRRFHDNGDYDEN
jgi:hypothetical protein